MILKTENDYYVLIRLKHYVNTAMQSKLSLDPYFYAVDLGLTEVRIGCFYPFSALHLDLGSRVPVRTTRASSVCGSGQAGQSN